MPGIHHDLPMTSYALLGMLAVGQEAFGLQMALALGLGLVAFWVALSLFAALVAQLRKTRSPGQLPPK